MEALVFRRWPRPAAPVRPTVDLVQPAVWGLPLGAPAARVRECLGAPASWREQRRGCWAYPAQGLRVDVPADRELESFTVALRWTPHGLTTSRLPWRPFEGQLVLPGRTVSASRLTRQDLEAALGPPTTSEQVMDDSVCIWTRGRWLLEVSFSSGGQPLYANVQRAADRE